MINQIQTIRTFVTNTLGDLPIRIVIDRNANGEEMANGDRASAVLALGDKRFRIVLTSAYVEPTLGRIVFTDLETKHVIEGQKNDARWSEIAQYIRNPQFAPPFMPQTPVSDAMVAVVAMPKPAQMPDRLPYLGQGVKFITGRGEYYSGMDELAAMVTRIHSPTKVSLTIFPHNADAFWRNDVERRSPELQHHCWDFAEATNDAARKHWAEGAISALNEPFKRGPGRPRKIAAGE